MEKVIVFQGDSITDGIRDRSEKAQNRGYGYVTMVSGELMSREPYTYTCLNRGISGNRVVDLYACIRQDLINLKPDYLSVLVGINDVIHEWYHQNGVSAKKYELVYNLLLEEVKRDCPNVKLMVLEPFVLPGSLAGDPVDAPEQWEFTKRELDLRRAAAKRVAEKQGAIFVPLQEMFETLNADAPEGDFWLRDGVHPTEAGHELIKQEWLKAFQQIR